MNALDPTVAEFRERLNHQRTEKKRCLNAMNASPWPVLVCQCDFCRACREHPRAAIEGKIVGKVCLPSIIQSETKREPS